jgi:nucleotide-binding universal stress UspA family protein
VAARFLEAVRLPRGAALSIVHATAVPHVVIRFPGQQIMLADWRKEAATDARRLIGRLVLPLRVLGLRERPLVREGLPRPLLLNTVKRVLADFVILGFHGYSRFMRFLLGCVSKFLLSEAPASVLIVRGRPRGRKDREMRVVLAMDFSKDAKGVAEFFSKLRLPCTSRVMLLHVEERAARVMVRISGMGRIDLSQAVEQALWERKRRTLLVLERMGRWFAPWRAIVRI